ncbi:unnamed protein product [Pleuronectes platessa]|uniref:Uncharacterized protein n=1 Tax=Pleuronectes platessa TaxID=8262 RepID=A0A9N7TW38_PLEPL|nr:unnamed protein product [Pleuronectes platessa]
MKEQMEQLVRFTVNCSGSEVRMYRTQARNRVSVSREHREACFREEGPNERSDVNTRTPDSDVFTQSPTQDTEDEVHLDTTASPMNIPNHRPVLKGMLFHEHLLTRDFQGDQHFFMRDGSVAGYPTMPGSMAALDAGDAATQVVPHEDAPAFSDIASTATQAATSSLTTFTPTPPRPPLSLPKEKPSGVNMAQPTTDYLTTQVTPSNRGSGGENYPVVAPFPTKMEKDEARETPAKTQKQL